MTGYAVLDVLLGAVLVAFGVLASALSDRTRGIRLMRESAREAAVKTRHVAESVEPIEPVELSRKPRATRLPKDAAMDDGAEDVIAALIAAGFKKGIATEATWGCTAVERATITDWTRAALRRVAKGSAA